MEAREQRWLTTIAALLEHGLRVSYARAELYDAPLGEIAAALDEVCRRAETGETAARAVVAAFVPILVDLEHLPRVASVRVAAAAAQLPAAGRLLRCATEEGHELGRDDDGGAGAAGGREVTLGERRALARRPSRATVSKLLQDPHPMVARVLLRNPAITEDDVMRMAAHRPAVGDVAREIARSWSTSVRARMALVMNPGTPAAVSVPLLALLSVPELHEVRCAADLAPVVRATAHELEELRRPMRAEPLPDELRH